MINIEYNNPSLQTLYDRMRMIVARKTSNKEELQSFLMENARRYPVITAACIRSVRSYIPGDVLTTIFEEYDLLYDKEYKASIQSGEELADDILVMILLKHKQKAKIEQLSYTPEFRSAYFVKAYYKELEKYLTLKCFSDKDRISLLHYHYFNLHYRFANLEQYNTKSEILEINDEVVEIVRNAIERGRYEYLAKLADRIPLLSLDNLSMTEEDLYTKEKEKWSSEDLTRLPFFTAAIIERSDNVSPETLDRWKVTTYNYLKNIQNVNEAYLEMIATFKKLKHFPERALEFVKDAKKLGTTPINQFTKNLQEEAFTSLIKSAPETFPAVLSELGDSNIYAYSEKHDYPSATPFVDMNVGDEMIRGLRRAGLSYRDIIFCYFNSFLKSVYPLTWCLKLTSPDDYRKVRGIMKEFPVYGMVMRMKGRCYIKPYTYRGEDSFVILNHPIETKKTVSCFISGFNGEVLWTDEAEVTEKSLAFRTSRDYAFSKENKNASYVMKELKTNPEKLVALMVFLGEGVISTFQFKKYDASVITTYNLGPDLRIKTIPEQVFLQRFVLSAVFNVANDISKSRELINRIGNYRLSKGIFSYGTQPSKEELDLLFNCLYAENRKYDHIPRIAREYGINISKSFYNYSELSPEKITSSYEALIKMDLSYNEIHTLYFNTLLQYIIPINRLINDTFKGPSKLLKDVYGTRLQLPVNVTSAKLVSEGVYELVLWHTYDKSPVTVVYEIEERGVEEVVPGLYIAKFTEFDPGTKNLKIVLYESHRHDFFSE